MRADLLLCKTRWKPAAACLLGAVAVLFGAGRAFAQDVARVEEDWQLVVNQPDADLDGPQVTCVISPVTADVAYCAFDINYHTQPDYSAGGLQLHLWNPSQPIITSNFAAGGMMQTADETVTWTQTMSVSDGAISFAIKNGQSTTWGNFDNSDQPVTASTTATNLNNYDSNVSLDNSGVSFASNLVTSLTLTAVRWYAADGTLIRQNTTPQTVHPQD
jgi:hypothetical protein